MPRHRPPHLHRETNRHGTTVWFVRIGHGPRIRIRGDYGSQDFNDAYDAAIRGETAPVRGKFATTSLGWLIDRYRDSSAWLELSAATRRQRENIFKHVNKSAGNDPFAKVTK